MLLQCLRFGILFERFHTRQNANSCENQMYVVQNKSNHPAMEIRSDASIPLSDITVTVETKSVMVWRASTKHSLSSGDSVDTAATQCASSKDGSCHLHRSLSRLRMKSDGRQSVHIDGVDQIFKTIRILGIVGRKCTHVILESSLLRFVCVLSLMFFRTLKGLSTTHRILFLLSLETAIRMIQEYACYY